MDTQVVTEVTKLAARRSLRWRAVSAVGPVTALAGVGWAALQPYRLTFLHPRGEGFWWLAVEPPLLVIAVGLLFHLVIAPSLLRDLEDAEARREV